MESTLPTTHPIHSDLATYPLHRTTHLLKDRNSVVCGVLGGVPRINPNAPNEWDRVQACAVKDIKAADAALHYERKSLNHHRGPFPAVAMGISHGGGQTQPSLLYQTPHNRPILNALLCSPSLSRIAGFGNCLFRAYAPRLHSHSLETLDALEGSNSTLVRPFPGSAFAACTVNFGPNTATYPHRDAGNLTWGWCSVTALGKFNADRGGHLVLWDFNCVIRFPSGSTIIIPSALVRHSNVSIGAGETRYSVAQYSSGGLFRWVNAGFQSEESRLKCAPELTRKQRESLIKEEGARRWALGLGMLSTVQELL
ncbi:hypothetical protein BDN70DRAFT_966489 [Pholiota conissans]|uniref:Uncharacterized protein n=1 Tax=Pholiota conissans TaxID=109636 RepID=A0A9P5YR83_9AGAR|nr:hypothetical protein BDN70DRAFT_966489 [Pholiota conissans]